MAANSSQAVLALRKRFRYFLSDSTPSKQARRQVIQRLSELGWNACVFGGTIRDIAVRGPYTKTRDIDIVVEGIGVEEIHRAMGKWVTRRNSFGGLQLDVSGALFDIWPMHDTWALKQWGVQVPSSLFASFEVLPLTTFLSVESIAVVLKPTSSEGRIVYERGFFDSIASRVVELNREENPYPALCVARAIITAMRLDFRIGPRLMHYLLEQFKRIDITAFVEAQRKHYRHVLVSGPDLAVIYAKLLAAADREPGKPVNIAMPRQLEWDWARPEPMEQFVVENAELLTV